MMSLLNFYLWKIFRHTGRQKDKNNPRTTHLHIKVIRMTWHKLAYIYPTWSQPDFRCSYAKLHPSIDFCLHIEYNSWNIFLNIDSFSAYWELWGKQGYGSRVFLMTTPQFRMPLHRWRLGIPATPASFSFCKLPPCCKHTEPALFEWGRIFT